MPYGARISRCLRWQAFPRGQNLFDVAGETTLAGAQLFSNNPPARVDSWAVSQIKVQAACSAGC